MSAKFVVPIGDLIVMRNGKRIMLKSLGAYLQPLDPTELVTMGDGVRLLDKRNVESTDGLSLSRVAILKEIEENGAHMSDVFWMQWRAEIVEMEHEGLVETLDVSGYGQLGQTVRTLKLTPKGRLTMLIGSKQTSGKL